MIKTLENPQIRALVRPLSVTGYHILRDCGVIEIKTELLHGIVIDKMSKSPQHEYLTEFLLAWLRNRIPTGYMVRKEGPLTLNDSEPEPDISVVIGSAIDYRLKHPQNAELVVEIAVSSLAIDREKSTVYAAAAIPHYWLINVGQYAIEHYSCPQHNNYQQLRICKDQISTPFGDMLSIAELFF